MLLEQTLSRDPRADVGSLEPRSSRLMRHLDGPIRGCIHFRMTRIVTLRMSPALLEKAEAKAARLGVDRAKYLRSLIEEDLATGAKKSESNFASSDLAGMYEGDGKAATNQETRVHLGRK